MRDYYDARAEEYDRTSWEAEDRPVARGHPLAEALAALPAAHALDVGCGTGFPSRFLTGPLTLLDASARMLAIAARRLPAATAACGDAVRLPFRDGAFERVFAAHLYGHLQEQERLRFLAEARRVAPELVILDSAVQPDRPASSFEQRALLDGRTFRIWKRHFTGDALAAEIGGEALHADASFVLARRRW